MIYYSLDLLVVKVKTKRKKNIILYANKMSIGCVPKLLFILNDIYVSFSLGRPASDVYVCVYILKYP